MRMWVACVAVGLCALLAYAEVLLDPGRWLAESELRETRGGQQDIEDSQCYSTATDCTLFWFGGNQCVGNIGGTCYICTNTSSRYKFCFLAPNYTCRIWTQGDGTQPCGTKGKCTCWTEVLCGGCVDDGSCQPLAECETL